LTWDDLPVDLSHANDFDGIKAILRTNFADAPERRL
jgi:hypothetical protein